jgi:PAS domain S-box-containing protein
VLGRTRREMLGDADYHRLSAQIERAHAGETLTFDTIAPTLQGERQVMVTLVPDRDASGAVAGVFGVVTDITQRKQAEDALRLSERKSRALLDALSSGVVVHGPDTQVLDANPAALRFLGLSLEQLQGRRAVDPAWQFVEEDGTPMVLERFPVNQARDGAAPVRGLVVGLRRPDLAQPLWALCSAFALKGEDGGLREIVVTFSDFTERKVAEEELRRSESRLRIASRLARLGGWRFELPQLELTLSTEMAEMLGADASRPLALQAASQLVTPASQARWRECIEACMRGGPPFDEEIEAMRHDGQAMPVRVMGECVRNAAGQVVAVQGAVQDITERRRAEASLRAAREELAATLEAVPDMLFDIDLEGTIHSYHSPRSELLFLAPEHCLGRKLDEVLPAEPAAVLAASIQQAHAHGHSEGLQYEMALAQGPHWFEPSVSRRQTAPGEVPHFVVLVRDITDRKQSELERRALEQQLRESQKMESIGTLAGGIAHDFNNILAGILGNVALARQDLPAGHAALASLDQINKAGQRARNLVQQILAFSRRQDNEMQAQPLRPAVEETLSLLRTTLPASVRLDTRLAAEPLPVLADATQVQQVLMNLCTNA